MRRGVSPHSAETTPDASDVEHEPSGVTGTYGPGDVIAAKYQLLSPIGQGGMGAVWVARNLTLNVDVAIKLIRRDIAHSEIVADRLLREARAAAQLGHPSIVRVHDFGVTERDDPFIVMELLNGESLAELLDRLGTLAEIDALQMLLPIFAALQAAHKKGIVHRDIKPENIILVADETGTPVPKLVDFGIAMHKRDPQSDAPGVVIDEASKRKLTLVGTIMGSPEYMSPEQAEGSKVDERCDVWSLSVVLYECLSGQRPFEGEALKDVLVDILVSEPAPLDGDPALWQIIARGLAKSPADRWQSADEMGSALASWLLERNVELDVSGTSLRKAWFGADVSQRIELTSPGLRLPDDPLGVNVTPQQIAKALTAPAGAATSTGSRIGLPVVVAVGCVAIAAVALAAIGLLREPAPAPALEPIALPEVAVLPAPAAPTADEPDPPSAAPATSATTAELPAPPAPRAPYTPPPRRLEDDPGF